MRDLVSLKDFSSVGAGQRATLDIAPGPTFHGLIFEFKRGGALATQAQMEADISLIRLKLNGKVQREFTPTQLFKILGAYNQPIVTGYIYIPFSEPWARTPLGEDGLAWGTGEGVETFQISVDIVGGVPSPELKAFAEVSYEKRAIGFIKKMRSNEVPITKTGVNAYSPEIQPLDSYSAIHCFSSNITSLEVETDRNERFEGSKTFLDALYRQKGITPQTGVTHIMFNQTGRPEDALPMVVVDTGGRVIGPVRQANINFVMSAATSFTAISETIGRPD